MLKINVIFNNLRMPADLLPVIEAPDGSYQVVWSRTPQSDSDVVVYFNDYVYDRGAHDRICPKALRFLYMYEPPSIDPIQYTERVWKKFDALLTWNTYLTGSSPRFTFEAGAYFDLPFRSEWGVPPEMQSPLLEQRERAVCQISGDKYSLSAEEIYSRRRKVSRWFHNHAKTRMDVFGMPAMRTPNYRGTCADKAETFSKYRYALCFENTYHPLWTRGYLTEKILDCMASQTIPIYLGCSNIEELVPTDCFIDFRKFDSLEQLDDFLQSMSDEEYLAYAERMHTFTHEYNAPHRHSAFRLYETVTRVFSQFEPDSTLTYPKDYLKLSSFTGRLRYIAMKLLLPHHRLVYAMFSVARFFGKSS